VYASRTRREKFSGHNENCPQNVTDLKDSLVTSSRPPSWPQKRPDDQTSNDGVAAQAADGNQRTFPVSIPSGCGQTPAARSVSYTSKHKKHHAVCPGHI